MVRATTTGRGACGSNGACFPCTLPVRIDDDGKKIASYIAAACMERDPGKNPGAVHKDQTKKRRAHPGCSWQLTTLTAWSVYAPVPASPTLLDALHLAHLLYVASGQPPTG